MTHAGAKLVLQFHDSFTPPSLTLNKKRARNHLHANKS
jgi:hypothetical protein